MYDIQAARVRERLRQGGILVVNPTDLFDTLTSTDCQSWGGGALHTNPHRFSSPYTQRAADVFTQGSSPDSRGEDTICIMYNKYEKIYIYIYIYTLDYIILYYTRT